MELVTQRVSAVRGLEQRIAALQEDLKGAFTGALRDNPGRVAACEGGTLFLDEVGDLPLSIQPKLLRFIQDREYERVGDQQTRRADVRIITAMPGEQDKANRIRDLFSEYSASLLLVTASESPWANQQLAFFGQVLPIFQEIKGLAQDILEMNQANMDGVVDFATETAARHFGMKPGISIRDLGMSWLQRLAARAIDEGCPTEGEKEERWVQQFIEGREYFFQPMAIPLSAGPHINEPTGMAIFLKDVTQVHEQQELKRGVVSTVSHQLKTRACGMCLETCSATRCGSRSPAARSPSAPFRNPMRSGSPSKTPGPASLPSTWANCSNRFSAPPARIRRAAPGWDWRSSGKSSWRMAGPFPCRANPGRAHGSVSRFPYRLKINKTSRKRARGLCSSRWPASGCLAGSRDGGATRP